MKHSKIAAVLVGAVFAVATGISAQTGGYGGTTGNTGTFGTVGNTGTTAPSNVKNIYIHGLKPINGQSASALACHGTTTGTCGDRFPYRGPGDNVVFVGFDNTKDSMNWNNSQSGISRLVQVLNAHCRSDQNKRCRIISHSYGGFTTNYMLSNFSGAYNIDYHLSMASAEGGSWFAELGSAFTTIGNAILLIIHAPAWTELGHTANYRLWRSASRLSYNHSQSPVQIYTVPGVAGGITDILHMGKDDSVLGFHSQCGYPIYSWPFANCDQAKIFWKTMKPYHNHKTSPKVSPTVGVYGAYHIGKSSLQFISKYQWTHSGKCCDPNNPGGTKAPSNTGGTIFSGGYGGY